MKIEDQLMQLEERSEYSREILGRTPSWLLRWGTTLIFAAVVLAIGLAWLLKYPDIIPGQVIITTQRPPVRVVAPAAGEIKILVNDSEKVEIDQPIAMIQNPTSFESVGQLKHRLQSIANLEKSAQTSFPDFEVSSLGYLQVPLSEFRQNFQSYHFDLQQETAYKRKQSLTEEYEQLVHLVSRRQDQLKVLEEQKKIALNALQRVIQLHNKKLIAEEAVDDKKSAHIQLRKEEKQLLALIAETKVEIAELNNDIVTMELNIAEQIKAKKLKAEASYANLISEIARWEKQYLLLSPISGFVSWSRFWSDHQYVQQGESVFAIVPSQDDTIIGKMLLPMQNSGKVLTGQKVFIKLDGFPYREFGILQGNVKSIGLIPEDQSYQIEIELSNRLTTSFNRMLPFRQEMVGSAEIVTKDMRLLERIYYRLINGLSNS